MELNEAIEQRRATRDYTDQPLDKSTIMGLLRAAVWAPSAMNLQPWAFLVVQDRSALHRFSDAAKGHLLSTIVPSSPLANYRAMLTDRAFEIFYGAPTLIVVCTDGSPSTEATHATEDCCLAAENLMLAAHATGLGSCWIGFARPWLSTEAAKADLAMPKNWVPVAPIIVGHPRQAPPPSPRKAPSVIWYEPGS